MENLAPVVLLLLLGILYMSINEADKSSMNVILLIIILIFVYCYYNMRDSFINYASTQYKMGKCGGIQLSQKRDVLPIGGSYSNLVLKPEKRQSYPLVSDVTIFSPVGDGIKLTPGMQSHRFPSVDGRRGSPKKMFMFAHNQHRPECCPSTYSSSLGCVCTTDKQRKFLNMRGANRTDGEDPI